MPARPKQTCTDCGKQVGVRKNGTLWPHVPPVDLLTETREWGERCPGSGRNVVGQRLIQVVVSIVITDSNSEHVEQYTSSRIEENLHGGRHSDVLAASRALEWNRKALAKQLDRTVPPLRSLPAESPPCEEDVVLERFPEDDRPITNPVDSDYAEVLALEGEEREDQHPGRPKIWNSMAVPGDPDRPRRKGSLHQQVMSRVPLEMPD